MRLKRIKLAGFKSFVDPTSISLPASLIGVVGPNGCGKSNIIDAVRWVMGEISAKNLRGDSMADVIFSGSSSRKPVGKAFVELVFDNSEGKAPGPYASYSEIAIRREVARDCQSDYFINKTKCRRKDITDIFLGTGLGPRSYSIIEQGMVTRVIEGKPEDMRAFIEEAAGISRYKDRRRETETRVRHTRENLERVDDIRSELESQLRRLKRQSRAAARYKVLKSDQRLVHAQLLALRWQELATQIAAEEGTLRKLETDLEARRVEQRAVETRIEEIRQRRAQATDSFNAVQAEFYGVGAEIAGVEQAIDHARETHQQRIQELEQLDRTLSENERHLADDRARLKTLEQKIAESGPRVAGSAEGLRSAEAELTAAEAEMQRWQARWEELSRTAAQPAKDKEVQGARIRQLAENLDRIEQRRTRLVREAEGLRRQVEGQGLSSLRRQAADLDEEYRGAESALAALESRVQEARTLLGDLEDELEPLLAELTSSEARLTSLEELQAAALGEDDEALNEWLRRRGLDGLPRLAGEVKVEPGWERVVERLIGAALGAVCVERLEPLAGELESLGDGSVCLVERREAGPAPAQADRRHLLSRVQAPAVDLSPLLHGVFVAEDLVEALRMRGELAPGEVVATSQGALVGANWISLGEAHSAGAGTLARAGEIDRLREGSAELGERVAGLRGEIARRQEVLDSLLLDQEQARRDLQEKAQARAGIQNRLSAQTARTGELVSRLKQIDGELEELSEERERHESEQRRAREHLTAAEQETGSHEQARAELAARRETLQRKLEQIRQEVHRARDAAYQEELARQGLLHARDATRASIDRLQSQVAGLAERRRELAAVLAEGEAPEQELQARLDALLEQRVVAERRLAQARQALDDLETDLREREQGRSRHEQKVQETRELLEQGRMARRELVVRQETLAEQVAEAGFELEPVRRELPEDATEESWRTRLEELDRKISRIGPVNLVAIEEYEEQSERKGYLDSQRDDLTQALATLEDAMRKIDRETRTRFKETFDRINTGFQEFFPRLFGGGHAYLELTGDDLLTAGVTVMARPPGKRNSTIHLLSGGEKALTAVALMFAFFNLNPAPFCLLDEVDAPLDDANVERFSETLRVLSERSQMIFITHNKITMETADILLGVTMAEPGVSRLVAVDVVQAVELAAQAQ